MFFIEDKDFLTDNHKEVIELTQNSNGIPYFYQRSFESAYYEDMTHTLLSHVLCFRPGEQSSSYNSSFAEIYEDMLFTFCSKNQIICNEMIRAVINLTYNNGNEKCYPHVDHKEYHKQLIIYLNDPKDKESHTVIMKKETPCGKEGLDIVLYPPEKYELKRIVPEKYKGVCFENLPHYQIYPRFGDRVAAIFTFK